MAHHRKCTKEFIQNDKARLATFQRRSKTLLKNASELSILCDVDVAAVIYSDHLSNRPLQFPLDSGELGRIITRFKAKRPKDKDGDCISRLNFGELTSLVRILDAKSEQVQAKIDAIAQTKNDQAIVPVSDPNRRPISVIRPPIQTRWQDRVFNFAAGPATLLDNVLKKAQSELYNWRRSGMSVMEMTHRGKEFLLKAESGLRLLLGIPHEYAVLFLQGSATTQFDELNQSPSAKYLHICANETTHGVEFKNYPTPANETGILIADMPSVDVSKLGVIYAGAQKNVGPSGVTIVIIRKDLIGNAQGATPVMLDYKIHAENNSLHNTPPCYGIYMCGANSVGQRGFDRGGEEEQEKGRDFCTTPLMGARDSSGAQWRSQFDLNVPFTLEEEVWRSQFDLNVPFTLEEEGRSQFDLNVPFTLEEEVWRSQFDLNVPFTLEEEVGAGGGVCEGGGQGEDGSAQGT